MTTDFFVMLNFAPVAVIHPVQGTQRAVQRALKQAIKLRDFTLAKVVPKGLLVFRGRCSIDNDYCNDQGIHIGHKCIHCVIPRILLRAIN